MVADLISSQQLDMVTLEMLLLVHKDDLTTQSLSGTFVAAFLKILS
jgi:hypothetical protein